MEKLNDYSPVRNVASAGDFSRNLLGSDSDTSFQSGRNEPEDSDRSALNPRALFPDTISIELPMQVSSRCSLRGNDSFIAQLFHQNYKQSASEYAF